LPVYRFKIVDHKYRTYFIEADSEELARRRLLGGDKQAGKLLRSESASMKREVTQVAEVNLVEPTSGIRRLRRWQRRKARKSIQLLQIKSRP